MKNMFNVLYNQYIEQIKLQQIQNYNEKHKNYLIRQDKQIEKKPQQNIYQKNQIRKQKNSQKDHNQDKNQQKIQSIPIINKQNIKFSGNQQNYSLQYEKTRKNDDRSIKSNNNMYSIAKNSSVNEMSRQNIKNVPQKVEQTDNFRFKQEPVKKITEQRSIKQSQQLNQSLSEFPNEQEEVNLEQCPEGCGRKFKQSALQKHIKICQKVFQGKRKPFKVDIVDEQAKKLANKNSKNQNQKPKTQKVPKWKKQSQMLRKGLKFNQQGGGIQQVAQQEQDDRKQCPGCGRKFNEQVADRHIPNCLKRLKQKK